MATRRSKKNAEKGPYEPNRHARRGGVLAAFHRFLATVLGLGVILYVALFAISRTAGFASIVEGRLAKVLPATWHVRAARIQPPLRLQFQDIRAASEAGDVFFSAREIEIEPAWRALLRGRLTPVSLHIADARLVVTATATGWAPAAAAPWAALLHPAGLSVPSPLAAPAVRPTQEEPGPAPAPWPAWRVIVDDLDIDWRNAQGENDAAARGLRLRATPLSAPGRTFTHLHLRAAEWRAGPDAALHNLDVEWLAHGSLRWILSLETPDGNGAD